MKFLGKALPFAVSPAFGAYSLLKKKDKPAAAPAAAPASPSASRSIYDPMAPTGKVGLG